jgi:very-short-patch-repair endonuclease
MNKKTWNDNDILLLIKFYPEKTDVELQKLFPDRTLISIKVKAKKLKLKKNYEANIKNRSFTHSGEKNAMYGKKSKLKDKTYLEVYGEDKSNLIKDKLSIYRKNNPIDMSGDKNPMYGKEPHNKGCKTTEKIKKLLSKKAIERYKNLSNNEKNKRKNLWVEKVLLPLINNKIKTKPELIFESLLITLNIKYEPQKPIDFYVVDYCVGNKVFEVQGDYWHGNPEFYDYSKLSKTQKNNIRRDKAKKTYLENNGYQVFYFWENDLKKNENTLNNLKLILYEKS